MLVEAHKHHPSSPIHVVECFIKLKKQNCCLFIHDLLFFLCIIFIRSFLMRPSSFYENKKINIALHLMPTLKPLPDRTNYVEQNSLPLPTPIGRVLALLFTPSSSLDYGVKRIQKLSRDGWGSAIAFRTTHDHGPTLITRKMIYKREHGIYIYIYINNSKSNLPILVTFIPLPPISSLALQDYNRQIYFSQICVFLFSDRATVPQKPQKHYSSKKGEIEKKKRGKIGIF